MLSNWIKYYNVLLTWSALYTSLVSFEVLLLSKAHWIVSFDQRSIKMSVASLLHNLPRFFDAISSTRFWRLKSSFLTPEPSHSWSVRARGGAEDSWNFRIWISSGSSNKKWRHIRFKLGRAARFTKRKNGVSICQDFLLFATHQARLLSNWGWEDVAGTFLRLWN